MRGKGGDLKSAAAGEETPRVAPLRVLVADDNEIHRRLLSTALAGEGHETIEAVDGVDALEKLRSGGFDAVISDVLMPRMDGFRLGYEVRRNTELENTRIIIYSRTYASLADERMALKAGADRFVRSPLGTEAILRALRDATHAPRPRKEAVPPAAELAACKEYSEVLVGKLESANLKLEASRNRLARANEKIRENGEQVRLLLDSTAEGIYGLDLEGNFTFCNAAGLAMLGYSSARELLGRNAHTLVRHTRADGESYPMDESGVFRAIRENRGSHAEDEILWRADGTSFSTESWSYPVRKDGTLVGAVVTFLDIAERKRAQEALKTSEQLRRKNEEIANAELEAARQRLAAAYDSLQESEKAYRELVDLAPTGIVRTTPAGKVLAANEAFAGMLGFGSSEELLGVDVGRDLYFDPAERAAVVERWARPGPAAAIEFRLKRRDGTPFWAQGYGRAVRDSSGNILRYEVFVQDIDLRKKAEESVQKLLHAVEQTENVVLMTDPDGAITYVNPAFERVYGYTREETLGKTPRILKGGGHDRAYYERFWQRLLAGESVREEFVNRRRDGQLVPVESSVSPVLDSRGSPIGFISLQHDLTERKRSEERVRISEEKYRLLFDSNPLPMWVYDNETLAFLAVNQAACRYYGYSLDEFLSMTIKDIRPPEDISALLRRIERKGSGFRRSGIRRYRKKDGTLVHAEVTSAPFGFDGRSAKLVLANDVTDRLRAEEGMRKSEERFRKLFESNTIGISVADLSGQILESNDAYLGMIGYTREELLSGVVRWDGMTPAEYREKDQIAIEQLQRTGVAQPYEKALIRKDGTHVPLLIGIAMLEASERSIIAFTVDLSSRRKLEEQFRQAQKMEAVGQLAGGVAHDFNNLLTAILGYSDLLGGRLAPGSIESEELDEIRKAGERATSLTRQLLAFSRQQVLERKVLDLNDLIADIEKMLRRLIGEDVKLTTVLDPVLRRVFADAGQVEQVIMNLAVNARDAMPRGGRLTIETANVDLDEVYARQHVTVRPGSYVMIAVSDTGIGMNGETLAHVFEPFFTTKGLGKGTGLGLATVYGIVKQSGGYIWAYSEVGKGTTFKVYLPRVEGEVEAEPIMAPDPALLTGSETVLLVEDEESVRVLCRSILEGYGYTVLEAATARDGLEIARQYSPPIHMLLTDVVMPEMGGPDLASRLEALRPGVRVLYMSGYTDDAIFRHGLLEKGPVFLQKPFTPEALARKVREALGG
jgi:two-component system cell cycle sensor histidine kinase/response regulator CckA